MNVSRKTSSLVLRSLMLSALVALAARPALAAVGTVSGTFGSNTVRFPGYTGPMDMDALAGGSFSGTFSTDNLPLPAGTQMDLTSFSLDLFDSTGSLVHTYSDQSATDFAFVDEFTYNGEQLSTLNFQRYADGDRSGLQLTFAPGFEGTGTTPDSSRFNGFNGLNASNSDDLSEGWEKISVVSATAVVPEPMAGGLALTAVLIGLAQRRRVAG
jgi:hypothetical protein